MIQKEYKTIITMVAQEECARKFRRYRGRIFPDGSFSLGFCKADKKSEKECLYDIAHSLQYEVHKYYKWSYRGREEKTLIEWRDSADWWADEKNPMGLSNEPNSHSPRKPKVRRGLKGISHYATRMVKSGAAVLQQKYGRKRLGMLTCTLPCEIGSARPELWSELVRQFIQETKRRLLRAGGSGHIVGCVEIQEERFEGKGEVCPHLHLIFESHKGDWKYYLDKVEIRKLWEHLLGVVLGEEIEELAKTTRATTRIEAIKKDARQYIGKYLSKGSKTTKKIIEVGKQDFLPSCWWVCTNKLRKYILKHIIALYPFIKEALLSGWDVVGENICSWVKKITIDWQGEVCVVGWSGHLIGYQLTREELLSL